ncbi:MAG TPA: chloride channel protein [bacterium]|nr:chloride channel protein [bacterium]
MAGRGHKPCEGGAEGWIGFLLRNISRFKISPIQITFAFAIIIGLAAGAGAYVFRFLILLVEELCHLDTAADCVGLGGWLILLPAAGGLIVGPLIYLFAREAKGHGVPEVMYAVLKKGGRIRPIVAVIKSIASALTIGTGGSAGSEGPIVQIGAGFGSTLGQIFRMPPQRIKTFVACGAAGGISAIFNAPFGGIMFALEVILGEFRGLNFIYVAIASVVSALLSRMLSGNAPIFDVPTALKMASPFEIVLYLGLGAFVAFVAKLFIHVLEHFEDWYDRLRFPDYLKASTGGLAVGLMAYFAVRLVPVDALGSPLAVMGVGYHTIGQVMNGVLYDSTPLQALALSLLLLGCFKIVATGFTLGSGGSGGVFAPSLFIGAMAGGLYGIAMEAIFGRTSGPACYALVGMGACFAGAAHAPITAIFILFEMTDSYEIILPIIGAVVVSSLVAHWIKKESVYTEKLRRKGVDLDRGKKKDVLEAMVIGDVMIRSVQTIPVDMSLEELKGRVGKTLHTSLPVTDPRGNLIGVVSYKELHQAFLAEAFDPGQRAEEIMNTNPVVAFPDEPVSEVFRRMQTHYQGFAPVLKGPGDLRVIGLVTYSNIFDAYERALLE